MCDVSVKALDALELHTFYGVFLINQNIPLESKIWSESFTTDLKFFLFFFNAEWTENCWQSITIWLRFKGIVNKMKTSYNKTSFTLCCGCCGNIYYFLVVLVVCFMYQTNSFASRHWILAGVAKDCVWNHSSNKCVTEMALVLFLVCIW